MTNILFFLLLLSIPVQLGKHFFQNYSYISGIRIDYLAPTVYVSDILVLCLLGVLVRQRDIVLNILQRHVYLIMVCGMYILYSVFFVSKIPFVSLYAVFKGVEMVLLGFCIYLLKPKESTVARAFSFAVMYSSIIALSQFFLQHSVGGVLWWLGERTFYASTPGIAAISIQGDLLLRGYGTFPHPNVLGGFLAVTVTCLLYRLRYQWRSIQLIEKYILCTGLILGYIALIVTFSRTAWVVAISTGCILLTGVYPRLFHFILQRSKLFLVTFICTIFFSIVGLVYLPVSGDQSIRERIFLMNASVNLFSQHLYTGIGIGQVIPSMATYVTSASLFLFQPVHNIYMLFLTETGIIGGVLLLWAGTIIIRSTRVHPMYILLLAECFIFGFTDHYLLTLHQGQLLFTVAASLAFSGNNS